ncbi:LETM1-related biofilm-associated protein [Pontimicrobium sp. SW4]|uniref:LETM1-related biofilm-associated protein n=1 Tax=Pontimicrobium sp. SW4 TaxID=3153519 RepID=A0AAU7BVP8_9FLAO
MNPSANGWILKLQTIISENSDFLNYRSADFYCSLKSAGFIYGSNISAVKNIVEKKDLSNEELSKINLFLTLQHVYIKSGTTVPILESLINFYKKIKVYKLSFFGSLVNSKYSLNTLERIIHKRVQIDDNILTKNFNYFIINALLFVDALAYHEYLTRGVVSSDYIKKLEASIETIILEVLNTKTYKTKHDKSLIKLVEASLRFGDSANISYEEAINNLITNYEKWYLLDIACMATWSDKIIDPKEQQFLYKLGNDLKLKTKIVNNSITTVNNFYTKNKGDITLLSSSNIVKNFYDNSSKMVSKLISRNKKRLQKELVQSKELVKLIGQSTVRDLSKTEQKQLQEQLIDIIKSIPSLAIFMLPGGALLLPLFIKFIPKLLPSSFDDNRIEES